MKIKKYDDRTETLNDKGELHSFNKPAIEWVNGSKTWYKEGKIHRIDGPAMIDFTANLWWYSRSWWEEGRLHRLDRPAVEHNNGAKFWFYEGKLHKLDGPAIESSDGSKEWYKEDKRHRLDGPAVEYSGGSKNWYYEGKKIECKSTEEFLKIINLKAFW